jgi:hypothetical protein
MFKHYPSSFAWMAAFFAALGTLFFVVGAHTFYRNWQFSGKVERTKGVVTDKHISISHGRHGSTHTNYHVSYRYFDLNGSTFFTSCTVVYSTYYHVSVNGEIPIKYLPQEHGLNRIDFPAEDSNYTTTATVFSLIGGGFGGFGWFSFITLERLIFYRRWLRKNGVRCAGKIERIEDAHMKVNKREIHYLVYSYTDSLGRQLEGSTEGLPASEDELWSEGDRVVVFCDPRDSSRSAMLLSRG